MKTKFLKYYIIAFYLCSTFVMFADPGMDDQDGALEGGEPMPIDDYIWILAIIGLFFVFMKFKSLQKNRIQG